MTDLIEFRRRQQIKKQLKKLAEQFDKQDATVKQLENLFEALTHDDFLTKEALAAQSTTYATKEELRALKAEIPKPYVHPTTGVCPQKPRGHRHAKQDIIDLKIPKPYDIEQLKRDHPKLREPHLHPPLNHTHQATEIAGRIQPEQIETKGLDADTVDGKHAKDLVKRIYAGGGPHTHPESEVDFDIENGHKHDGVLARQMSHAELAGVTADQHHAKLHASDHLITGADPLALTDAEIPNNITLDDIIQITTRPHSSLQNIGTDDHHAKIHAASHRKGGDDIIGHVIALKFGAEGSTTTSTTYVTIADSDIALNPALFNLIGTLYVKFIYHIKNDTVAETTYIRVYRQNSGTVIAGSEKTVVGAGWAIVETAWIDWSNESGNESYQVQMKVTGGVGEFNSALMILSPVQL